MVGPSRKWNAYWMMVIPMSGLGRVDVSQGRLSGGGEVGWCEELDAIVGVL